LKKEKKNQKEKKVPMLAFFFRDGYWKKKEGGLIFIHLEIRIKKKEDGKYK